MKKIKPEFVKIEIPPMYGFEVEAQEREGYVEESKGNSSHTFIHTKQISIKFPPEALQFMVNTKNTGLSMLRYFGGNPDNTIDLKESIADGKIILENMVNTKLTIDHKLIQFCKEHELDQFLIQGFDGFAVIKNTMGKLIVQATPAGFFNTFEYSDHPTWRNKIKYYSYHNNLLYERHMDQTTLNEYTNKSVVMLKGFPVFITLIGNKKIAFCCSGLIRSMIRDFYTGEIPFNLRNFLRSGNKLINLNKVILKHMIKMAYDKEASIEVILPTEDGKYTRILRVQNYHQKSKDPKPVEYDHFRYNGKYLYWKWNLVESMNY